MHLDIVFKAFTGVLVAIVIIGSGIGVTTGFSQMVEANHYLESVSKLILESNYNSEVINYCMQEAKENGYELEVNLYQATRAGTRCYAELTFTYYFEIKLFGIKQQKIQMKII